MLCEAVIITPMSALRDLINIGKAGVGNGPTKITSIPIEIKPEAIKGSNKYPDKRVSFEIITRFFFCVLI